MFYTNGIEGALLAGLVIGVVLVIFGAMKGRIGLGIASFFGCIFASQRLGLGLYSPTTGMSVQIELFCFTLGAMLGTIALLCLLIGFFKPSLVIRWGVPEGKTRLKVVLVFGIIAGLLYFGAYQVAIASRNKLIEENARHTTSKEVQQPVVVNSTPSPQKNQTSPQGTSIEKKLKLEIVDGWTWSNEGTNYTKIKGRVKNVGEKNITYFKIAAEYIDKSGNVLDTGIANSTDTIRPGNQKEFEITKKNDPAYAKVRLIIEEVRE